MFLQIIGQRPTPGMVMGIDEAGKGCVLGDLVIGAVLWKDEEAPIEGLRDSKMLSAKRRESLFRELKSICSCVTVSLHADEITACRKSLLKYITIGGKRLPIGNILDLQIAATRMLLYRFMPRRAIIDCPHANPPKFTKLVAPSGVDIIAEHKADRHHKIVSAGSIVAKVLRDRKLKRIADFFGVDLGCGYPSDVKTRAWLESLAGVTNLDTSRVVRWNWSTCQDILGSKRVASELLRVDSDSLIGRQYVEEE